MIGSSYPIDEAVLARAPQLQVVSSISVGVDNYALPALHRARHHAVPHAGRARRDRGRHRLRAPHGDQPAAWSSWPTWCAKAGWTSNIGEDLFGFDVHGKTLGLLGFGRIGQAWPAARRWASACRCSTTRAGRSTWRAGAGAGRPCARMPRWNSCWRESDIVVAMLPLSDATRGLMDAREFGLMKPGAIFINGGRGATVQEAALLDALDRGTLQRRRPRRVRDRAAAAATRRCARIRG